MIKKAMERRHNFKAIAKIIGNRLKKDVSKPLVTEQDTTGAKSMILLDYKVLSTHSMEIGSVTHSPRIRHL